MRRRLYNEHTGGDLMQTGENRFESFREGMAAGHEAGRTQDLLYAVGFMAGFLWGFFAPKAEPRRVETMPRGA
jgi:hypothetical protein